MLTVISCTIFVGSLAVPKNYLCLILLLDPIIVSTIFGPLVISLLFLFRSPGKVTPVTVTVPVDHERKGKGDLDLPSLPP